MLLIRTMPLVDSLCVSIRPGSFKNFYEFLGGLRQGFALEAMKSPGEEMQSMKKASEAEVDKTFASTSKTEPSKQSVELPHVNTHLNPRMSDQPMETDFFGPSLPPRFCQSVQSDHGCKHLNLHSEHSDPQSKHSEQPQRVCSSRAKNHSDKKKLVRAK